VAEVCTVERLEGLAAAARSRLEALGYRNVHVHVGDGTLGWPEHAPFDGIVVTAGGPEVPAPLLAQLRVGARLVMPVGERPRLQQLVRVTRRGESEYERVALGEVAFVPLIGAAAWPETRPADPPPA
jgi:protein-L-isoaspartate(D-aspartate) O-methyltransferase